MSIPMKILLCSIVVAMCIHCTPARVLVRSCEGYKLAISCTNGAIIKINRANYGRTAGDVCPHPSIKTTQCHSSNSFDIVNMQCGGTSSCVVEATNREFGDPCLNTYKYLEVDYTCQARGQAQPGRRDRVCEGSNLHITCPPGRNILIYEGFYGRLAGSEICPHPSVSDQACYSSTSLSRMKSRCDNHSSCTVPADNGFFGDPCVGTYKYLQASHRCI